MGRRQDRPTKEQKPKEKVSPKPKETPEQMRARIREAFRRAFAYEDE